MKRILAIASVVVLGALSAASYGWTATAQPIVADAWRVDEAHTEVNFSVKHFFTPVTGSFDDYEIDLVYDAANPANSTIEARIAVGSVNTGNELRDDHLRSADFFAADEYPYMTFKSTSVEQAADGQLVARGILSIKGRKREVELAIALLGTKQIPEQMQEMLGGAKEIASFRAATTIDRGDFGVGTGSWVTTLVVGGSVDIEILVEAVRK